MTAEKNDAEREAVLRDRRAFSAGWNACHAKMSWPSDGASRDTQIRERYPLPKIERPLRGTFSDGTVAWWETGAARITPTHGPHIEYERVGKRPPQWGWDMLDGFAQHHVDKPEDVLLLARMIGGETETVEDDVSLLRSREV